MEGMEDRMLSNIFQNSSIHDFEFCEMYFKAGKKLLNFEEKSNAEYLNRYYEIFRQYFNFLFQFRVKNGHPYHDSEMVKLLKDSLYYRIIYVLRNSPVLTSAVAFHFQNVLKEDFSWLKKAMKKEKIKICSIGPGPASDVVAVVKVLNSLAIKMDKQFDFRITVIDSNANWKSTCFTVLSCLKTFQGATWKINFIEADILDRNSYSDAEVVKSIQGADVVLMVMLLFDLLNANLDAKETVKNISELMQCESNLFLLDFSLIEYVRSCFGLSGETENLHLVYENHSDFHILTGAENFYDRYSKNFTRLRLNYVLGVFVRSWIKTPRREISSIRSELRIRFKKDMEVYSQETMFLDHDFFENWLVKYADIKRKVGLNERSINKLLQEKRKCRIFFLDTLAKCREMVEISRKKLIGENALLQKGEQRWTDDIDEEAWENYVIQKKMYSRVKKFGYQNVMFDQKIPDDLKNIQ